MQAEFVDPLDRVLSPTVAPVANVGDPFLHLFPPGRAVEDVCGDIAFTGKHSEDFGSKAADCSEIARVTLQLFPATGIGRQQQAIDTALRHLRSDDLVATITLLE